MSFGGSLAICRRFMSLSVSSNASQRLATTNSLCSRLPILLPGIQSGAPILPSGRIGSVPSSASLLVVPVRHGRHQKHWLLKFRALRRQKVLPISLFDSRKAHARESMSTEQIRLELREDGIGPPRMPVERPISMGSTLSVEDEYVPPEGDGKASLVFSPGAGLKQRGVVVKEKFNDWREVKKIKEYDDSFSLDRFAFEAQETYFQALSLLQDVKKNEDKLHELLTEKAFPEICWGLDRKTLRWRFIESLEPPRCVHVRTTSLLMDDNKFAQITVRFHTKQALALYDQFGRLMYGSESQPRDCLEFVVFERHLIDEYGRWRVHGRIKQKDAPYEDGVIRRTLRLARDPDAMSDIEKELAEFEAKRKSDLEDWQKRRQLYMRKWWDKQAVRTRVVRKYKFK